jgi:hypothetical protein
MRGAWVEPGAEAEETGLRPEAIGECPPVDAEAVSASGAP